MKTQFMFKIKLITILIIMLAQQQVFSQAKLESFTFLIRDVHGDLNNDKKADRVIISMDTLDDTRPLAIQIFLSQPSGNLQLILSTADFITPMYPLGGNEINQEFHIPNVEIVNGHLLLFSDIEKGTATLDFLFRNGNFELMNVSKNTWDGVNTTTETNYNLLTGIKIEIDQHLGSEDIISERKTTIPFKSLPKIQDMNFSEFVKL